MPELVGAGAVCETGWKWWINRGTLARQPDVRSLLEKMEEIYRADRKALAIRARRFAVANYDMDRIFETHWKPYLARLERRVAREK